MRSLSHQKKIPFYEKTVSCQIHKAGNKNIQNVRPGLTALPVPADRMCKKDIKVDGSGQSRDPHSRWISVSSRKCCFKTKEGCKMQHRLSVILLTVLGFKSAFNKTSL